MPKKKQYEFDYEWSGHAAPQKGVNMQEKNPWNRPTFASVKPASSKSKCQSSTPVQAPVNIEKLKSAHPWQKPHWATVDKSPQKKQQVDIVKDSIPLPMLKKKQTPANNGTGSTTQQGKGSNKSKSGLSKAEQQAQDEIEEMERRIADAKARKAALLQEKKEQELAWEEEQRKKHTVEESKLERARRLAKEKEEARWRATLKEKHERDKEKREKARRMENNATTAIHADEAWQKKAQKESDTRTQTQQTTGGGSSQHAQHSTVAPCEAKPVAVSPHQNALPDDYCEEYEESESHETSESVAFDDDPLAKATELDKHAAELQRQIKELQCQLQLRN